MTRFNNMEDQIIELQSRVSFQEDTLQQLNQVVANQDRTIVELQSQVRSLVEKLQDVVFDLEQQHTSTGRERPPHY